MAGSIDTFDSPTSLYGAILELFLPQTRVLCWDRRGSGLSDPLTDVPSLDERVDELCAVLDARPPRDGLADCSRADDADVVDHEQSSSFGDDVVPHHYPYFLTYGEKYTSWNAPPRESRDGAPPNHDTRQCCGK